MLRTMIRFRRLLGQRSLHVLLGALFAVLFTWPLLVSDSPRWSWISMYGTWAAAIVVTGLLSLGTEDDEGLEEEA